ncbi:FAD-dependent 5-carboxymethylaminomethyl-2-thiouridine(34) oxidoreductase MnmC [Polaromonas sp. YR568]|uniref:FAD-dependent 5-carboxymethylaminomethyl-2-thiouridine(34) oxidoreductase MnmC n=1 Tax=Polaromonas sp. YR568 TaxID=1855301 RepID=UPI003137FC18
MPERIDWLEDGTASGAPYSPRFGDRYRSELGGLEQARSVFLGGCGLPAVWAGAPRWTVLETGFGLGLNFLVTWAAWKADPQRPKLLHFVSTEAFPASAADVLRSARTHTDLLPLAEQLSRQLWGLLPGVHRLVFDGGRVLLTLCIGDTKAMLREQNFEADSVYLDGFSPERNPDIWDLHTFKAVARCCKRGTRIATWTIARSVRDALTQCGFVVRKVPGVPPKRDNLQGEYDPAWEPRKVRSLPVAHPAPARCMVIGAGLAGTAVAASLARRGWQVTVLDAADAPATGASGLPAGVLAPHVSPDDSLLSRLSRSGARATWQQAEALLQPDEDYALTGVLERALERPRQMPADWKPGGALADTAHDWVRPATEDTLAGCRLPTDEAALWHVRAGWIRPSQLVKAWLQSPGIAWQGNAHVARLTFAEGVWKAWGNEDRLLASAELVVLAAGVGSQQLAGHMEGDAASAETLALQAIRGQVTWAPHTPGIHDAWPGFPVNGGGSLIPAVPLLGDLESPGTAGMAWITGSSYERDNAQADIRAEDQQYNMDRLRALLPAAAGAVPPTPQTPLNAWSGVRCATPTRLPALGPLNAAQAPGVWVCTGMGSRGLTFAALCGELLAARLHGEPLPVEQRLADALLPQRVAR